MPDTLLGTLIITCANYRVPNYKSGFLRLSLQELNKRALAESTRSYNRK